MCVDKSLEHALRDADRFLNGERSLVGYEQIDRGSFHILHHQHGVLVIVDEFIEARDVSMAQLLENVRFLDEALPCRHFPGQLFGHHLEDYGILFRQQGRRLERAAHVDVAHSAFADFALDSVIPDDGSDHFRGPSPSQ